MNYLIVLLLIKITLSNNNETQTEILQFCTLLYIQQYFNHQGAANNPHDSAHQQNLKDAAEKLREVTNAASENALKRILLNRLKLAAKMSAVAFTQALVAAGNCEESNTNKTSQLDQQANVVHLTFCTYIMHVVVIEQCFTTCI